MPSSIDPNDEYDKLCRIDHFLSETAVDGKDIVRLGRHILRTYSSMGFSIDDPEVQDILGIESENDTMDLESGGSSVDFDHVYRIYKYHSRNHGSESGRDWKCREDRGH